MIRCMIIILRFFLGFINVLFAGIRIVGPRWSVPPPTSTTSHTWVLEMASRFRDSWIFPLLWRPQIRWDDTCCDTWHSLSPCLRLVTAATARVLWPGLSQSRESSPCLVRARASCPRPACPPIPRLRSAPSATQRSVASEHTAHMRPGWQPWLDYGPTQWFAPSVSGLPKSADVRVQCVRIQPQSGLSGSVLQSPGETGGRPLEARAGARMTTASSLCAAR